MGYRFIEPLEEKPKVEGKPKVSVAERILKEFSESEARYARVRFERIRDYYKSSRSAARAIGGVAKRRELKISVYSDGENVYLEKLEM